MSNLFDKDLLVNKTDVDPTAYRTYKVLLNQASTAAPVATKLVDGFGGLIWTRTGVGTYRLTKVGAFPNNLNYVTLPKSDVYIDVDDNKFVLTWISADAFELTTYAGTDNTVLADDVLIDRYLNIEMYKL